MTQANSSMNFLPEDYVEKRDPSTLVPKIERVLLRLRNVG